jgi:hypothetical protein
MKQNSKMLCAMRAGASLAIGLAVAACAVAQSALPDTGRPPVAAKEAPPVARQPADSQSGAVRLARFSYVKGRVLWRPDSATEWSDATLNMPIRQGAQITTSDDARAEIQFDDGSTLRMTSGAVFSLDSLYSDSDGEFTELKMKDGMASLHIQNHFSVYQIDTPDGDVKVAGPAKVRLDATSYLKVGLQAGQAALDTLDGEYKLHDGDFAEVRPAEADPEIEDLPAPDDWDQFCDSRDADMTPPADTSMPSNVSLVAGNLDDYGTWQSDETYGDVWCPSGQTADWRPYCDGTWTYVTPFGWTWVSSEPWGWAPYHYGTWIHRLHGWAWVPGPKHQYWSPGLVCFTTFGNRVAWVPLAPCEVHFTGVTLAFRNGDWSNYFSIGGCGTYLAAGPDFVIIRAWDNGFANRGGFGTLAGYKTVLGNHGFRPHNALYGGATAATFADYQRGKGYTKLSRNSLSTFVHGRTLVAAGGRLVAGPANIKPSLAATTPRRTFVANPVSTATLDRAVYRGRIADPAQVLKQTSRTSTVAAKAPAPSRGAASRTAQNTRPLAAWNTTSSPAEAAARARQSLGYVGRSSGSSSPMADTYVRSSGQNRRNSDYDDSGYSSNSNRGSRQGAAGNSDTGYREGRAPSSSSHSQSTTRQPSGDQQPRYQPRSEQPRSDPPRQDPPRQDPPRQDPPRQQPPPRQEPPHQSQQGSSNGHKNKPTA